MTTGISSIALLSYYQSLGGASSGSSGAGGASAGAFTAPTPSPPWSVKTTTAQTNALIQKAISGGALFNPNAVKVSVPNASPNYKNLFSLYQGVTTLQDLANQAGAKGVTPGQLSQLQTAFAGGLGQLSTFLSAQPFRGFAVDQGSVATQTQSTAGVTTATNTFTTGVLVAGSSATPVDAFAGEVQFSMTATLPSGSQKVVDFNLDDMGSTPRSLSNVVSYLNDQLETAGVTTRFAVERTPGKATSTTVNGKVIKSPAGPDQFSLQIKGNSVEKIAFQAAASTPAIYLTQTAGITIGKDADAQQQLVKLTTDSTASNPKVFNNVLASAEKNAIATVTGSDGSVYVLANVTGPTPAGETGAAQSIIGSQDVALLRYDSAGDLMYSQVLGAAGSASGYGLAISDNGDVAVTGAATSLVSDSGTASSATTSTGFVSVYNNQGQPQWTRMVASGSAGQVGHAAFGADGSLYVTGTTTIPGTSITNGYLAGFGADGVQTFTTSLGPTSQTNITGVAVSGSHVVVAGTQNGDAVAQSYQLQPTGAPTLTATRDLGSLQGGSVAGVAVNSDGSIIIGGSTHNGALSAGTVTHAYAGGEEGFVANLSADLAASSSDTLAYYAGSGGDVRVTAVTAAGGQAYIAGQVVHATSDATTTDGFAAQIDTQTGAAGWSATYDGIHDLVAPNSMAVDLTGSSVLDALGLPSGPLDFSRSQTVAPSTLPGALGATVPAQTLVANSAVRAGEKFTVKSSYGVIPQTVTIEANDTLQTLAQKIVRASGFTASATVVSGPGGVKQLQIKPTFAGTHVSLGAGPAGLNALKALGLAEGTVTANANAKATKAGAATTAASNSLKANYALQLPSTLTLATSAGVKQAQAVLGAAIVTIKQMYHDLTTPPSTSKGANTGGKAPAYLTAQIASYQAALNRLTAANGGFR